MIILSLLWPVFLSANTSCSHYDIQISLKNNTAREIETKAQLQRVLRHYDISKWIFTRNVLIDEQERIPHSHPVLTLNTDYLHDDLLFVSVFIHEQIHWFEEKLPEQRDKAIKELEALFPDAPARPPEGARSKKSTYLHLIVCYLEYQAMKSLAGISKAEKIMESWPYYTWVYKKVLNDGAKIKTVIENNNLTI